MSISLLINVSLVKAFFYNPNQLQVNYHTLKSPLIPETLNDTTIVYFTDLQYGPFQNDERCEKLFKEIKELNPDVLIFGGDLYDKNYKYTDDTNNKLIGYLSSIEAPMGKFAIYSDTDLTNDDYHKTVHYVLNRSEFEILRNTGIKITNQTNKGINLMAFDPEPNADAINALSSEKTFDILLTHYPDNLVIDGLMGEKIDLAIAGHSHDSQISFPIVGSYREVKGATKLNRNEYKELDFDYILSAGTGCTKVNARLQATPEIEYFILRNK